MVEFHWDSAKAERNRRKHGISFDEAASAFTDELGITVFDPDHSETEDRYITIGRTVSGRVVMVAHADRGDSIRIISARRLTRPERIAYEFEIRHRRG